MKPSSAVDGFVLWLPCGDYSPTTQTSMQTYMRLLLKWTGPDLELEALNETKLLQFWSWFCTDYRPSTFRKGVEHPAQGTRHNVWAYLRSFFKWADGELHTGRPDKAIQAPKMQMESGVQPFSEDEVRRMLQSAETYHIEARDGRKWNTKQPFAKRNMAIIMVLVDTGLRASELCRLDIRDYSPLSGELTIRAHGTAQKTHGRLVYLGKRARQVLWRYLSDRENQRSDDPLFLSEDENRMNRSMIATMLDNRSLPDESIPDLILAVMSNKGTTPVLLLSGYKYKAEAAVPYLIEAMQQEAFTHYYSFTKAFAEIGPEAAPAVPEIIRCTVENPEYYQLNGKDAVKAIAQIGPKTVPYLLPYLHDYEDSNSPEGKKTYLFAVNVVIALAEKGYQEQIKEVFPHFLWVYGKTEKNHAPQEVYDKTVRALYLISGESRASDFQSWWRKNKP
jgi:integrase/recombinase XerD